MNINLANRIAGECLTKFESLPKTGKPDASFEWTILSAIVLVRENASSIAGISYGTEPCDVRVVAMGTGTKCLGGTELSPRGDLVNDSHAEVLARRAFLRYLLEQIDNAFGGQGKESIFEASDRKFTLKRGHSFHFFTTHSPCGDASIFGEAKDVDDDGPPEKRPRTEAPLKRTIVDCGEDKRLAGMTGGKLLRADEHDDLMAQTIGPVRTKPGRGVRTLSVSCSDKLARWNVLGIQGSLLMLLLDRPIYAESFVLCHGTDHTVEAIERAIWRRFERWANEEETVLQPPFRHQCPVVIAANDGRMFGFRKNRPLPSSVGKYQPSPCGIVWCDVAVRPHEVEVAGRRHGVTKRKLATPAARLQISRIELFNRFVRTYRSTVLAGVVAGCDTLNNLVPAQQPHNRRPAVTPDKVDEGVESSHPSAPIMPEGVDIGRLSYTAAKTLSVAYAHQWRIVRDKMFGKWTEKPDSLGQFFIDANE